MTKEEIELIETIALELVWVLAWGLNKPGILDLPVQKIKAAAKNAKMAEENK